MSVRLSVLDRLVVFRGNRRLFDLIKRVITRDLPSWQPKEIPLYPPAWQDIPL